MLFIIMCPEVASLAFYFRGTGHSHNTIYLFKGCVWLIEILNIVFWLFALFGIKLDFRAKSCNIGQIHLKDKHMCGISDRCIV